MDSSKKIIIAFTFTLVVFVFVVILSFVRSGSNQVSMIDVYSSLPGPVADISQFPEASQEPMIYRVDGNPPVSANRLTRSRLATQLTDDGFYTITSDSSRYDIFYNQRTLNGYIMLYDERSLDEARIAAERTLMGTLLVPQEVICTLDFSVYTNEYVNPRFSGFDLGFSFCEGSFRLP